jgi:hypothetical protein
MAVQTDNNKTFGFRAGAAINYLYRFVKVDSTYDFAVKPCDTEGECPEGISYSKAAVNDNVNVMIEPGVVTPIEAGGVIDAGDLIIVDANGRAIDANDGGGTGDLIVAKALSSVTGAGQYVTALYYGGNHLYKTT